MAELLSDDPEKMVEGFHTPFGHLTEEQRVQIARNMAAKDLKKDVQKAIQGVKELHDMKHLLDAHERSGGFDFMEDEEEMRKLYKALNGDNIMLPTAFLKREEAAKQARDHSRAIFKFFDTLRAIMERHEGTIRKRWVKKSTEQRKQILRTAWNRPNMATTHRPDFHAVHKDMKKYGLSSTKATPTEALDHYMWPSINLEDLTRGKTLLLFLSSRARHFPHEFVHSDLESAAIGLGAATITTSFCPANMLVAGRTTPDTYGAISWDDDDTLELLQAGADLHASEGLRALEIQEEIYRFLMKCCHEILSHIPICELTDAKFPILPKPDMVVLNDSPFPSLESIAAEAPYRVPSELDFERLLDIVTANRAQAEDHIWSLREDPGYFFEACAEESEHMKEMIHDRHGNPDPIILDPSKYWDKVLGDVVTGAYQSYAWADGLYDNVTLLVSLAAKYKTQISEGSPLPEDFELEFQHLKYFVDMATSQLCRDMSQAVASPSLRSHFFATHSAIYQTQIERKTPEREDKLLKVLVWFGDKNFVKLFGAPTLIDIYQHLLKHEPEQRKRISTWTDRKASQLALYAEFSRQLSLFQPWATGMEEKMKDEESGYAKKIRKEYFRRVNPYFEPFLNAHKVPSLSKWGYPINKFFYPSSKRRTRQTVEAMRNAEENLDNFFRNLDRYFKDNKGRPHHQYLVNNKFSSRELRRTPEWVEPIPPPKPSSASKKAESDNLQPSFNSLLVEDGPAKPNFQPPRTKPKTRGIPGPSSAFPRPAEPPAQSDNITDVPAMKFSVSKRAHKTFSTLFFIPSTNDQPGEIPWTDFLYAMVAVGFEPEKLYGSIWQFTPGQKLREKLRECGKERSIQFHEPHPAAKFPYTVARRIGRRLERAYGWSGEAFVLA